MYLALSTICVAAKKLYAKNSDVESVEDEDMVVENKLFYEVDLTDSDQLAAESNQQMVHKENYKICEIG